MFNGKTTILSEKNNDSRENMLKIWTTGQPMVSFEKCWIVHIYASLQGKNLQWHR